MARHRKYVVKLSDEEVQRLKKIIRNVKTSQTIRSRCQILLLLDMAHGQTYNYEECATVTGTCIATVSNLSSILIHKILHIHKVYLSLLSLPSANAAGQKLNSIAKTSSNAVIRLTFIRIFIS